MNTKMSGEMNEVLKYEVSGVVPGVAVGAIRMDYQGELAVRQGGFIGRKGLADEVICGTDGGVFERFLNSKERKSMNIKSIGVLKSHPKQTGNTLSHMLQGQPALMRADKVAAVTGWSRRKIYELCEVGFDVNEPALLEAHSLPGRSVQRKQITRRSVAALLLRTANYDPRDFPTLLQLTLPTMALPQLREFATALDTEIRGREQVTGSSEPVLS